MRRRREHRGPFATLAAWCSPVACCLLLVVLLLGLSHNASLTPAALSESFDEPLLTLAIRTLAVSLTIGLIATLLALPWAWFLGTGAPRGMAALAMAPLLLPSYLVYAAWSLLRAPGTVLGDALATAPLRVLELANTTQAVLGLALWSWPLAVLVLTPSVRAIGRDSLDALSLTPASRLRRAGVLATELRAPILSAVALVAVVMAGSAVPLHVAQVETYAIATWRAIAEGRTTSGLLAPALPTLALASAGARFVLRTLSKHTQTTSAPAPPRLASRTSFVLSLLVFAVAVGGPLGLFVSATPDGQPLATFMSVAGESLAASATLGVIVGLFVSVVAFSASFASSSRAGAVGFLWVALALVPGVLIGSSVARASVAYAPLDRLGTSSEGLALAHVARFGAIGWIVGTMFTRREPRDIRDATRLYWNGTLGSWIRGAGPRRLAGTLAGVTIAVALLSLHEIEAAVVAAPAGVQPFARQMLNWLHYLRDDSLSTGALVLGFGGLGAGLFAMLLLRLGVRRTAGMAACVGAIALAGCDDRGVDERGRILNASVIGHVGRGDGAFIYPRAIDMHAGSMWIIDKTARVQQLTTNGEMQRQWVMPSSDRGKPCGVTFGADNKLYVADTHEHRVSVFDLSSDDPLSSMTAFGSYGEAPGQFIYPTDVAVLYGADGVTVERVYVSEYGGNDRVSVFDAAHEFLFEFGEQGTPTEGALTFRRPQSLLLDAERRELFISDAGNHRVGRFTLDGEPIAWFGRDGGLAGEAPGEFSYPYGLALAPDGSLLVSEFGNARIQRLDPETGACLGVYGAPGSAEGELVAPWGVACEGRTVVVLDSANNRAQRFTLPDRVSGL